MKAIICTKYGPPEVLHLAEVAKPIPKDNEVLIKVRATTVTSGDCRMRGFRVPPMFWLAGRIALGITKPKKQILGGEFSGVIVTVGKNVKKYKMGDQVIAFSMHNFGAYAEYCCMTEDGVMAIKPTKLSYEEAAAIPFGGTTALHFLRKGSIKKGQKILIYGASGAVGTYAVQLAKYFGADVTAVCSTGNLDMIKALGAEKVIDYTKVDFTKNGETYDIIFDAVGKTTFSHCQSSLKEKGVYINTVIVYVGLKAFWWRLTTGKKVVGGSASKGISLSRQAKALGFLVGLVETGKIKPVIDKYYPWQDIVKAHKYVDAGQKMGNVVIRVV